MSQIISLLLLHTIKITLTTPGIHNSMQIEQEPQRQKYQLPNHNIACISVNTDRLAENNNTQPQRIH